MEPRLDRLSVLAVAASSALALSAGHADERFPTKPVRIIQGFSIGGISDTVARIVGDPLQERVKQPVVVEARAGAGGVVGMASVNSAPKDGYTLLLGNTVITIAANKQDKPPFDPMKVFVPVSMIGFAPSILMANPSLPVRSVKALIDFAKARPGQIDCATSGVGTSNDLAVHLLNHMGGLKLTTIAYKGSAPSLGAVVSGETPLSFGPLLPAIPPVRSGRLKGLAVSGLTRAPTLPDVPAMTEFLPGYEAVGFYSIVAPAGVPEPVLEKLHTEINGVLSIPIVRKRLESQGMDVAVMSRKEFGDFLQRDAERWRNLVQSASLKF
ncbi:MAG: tripartite tricarboxylate transporter substrate binding protein [Burkholderiales bacterium]|nr:tripartite tricarboxylate transporter substrate binding protein [Burkholderiales bacterium]